MVLLRAFVLAIVVACLFGVALSVAATADGGTTYALITPPSGLVVGCQGPCECPDELTPTYGSFDLVKTGFDQLYTYYSVERYIASFNSGPGAVYVTGSGQYKIGGEFAAMQELTLDLDLLGGTPEHFDSGLVPVSVPFPKIDVSCAVHGFYCYDSVLVVNAGPTTVAGVQPPHTPVGIEAVGPNPFGRETRITFALDRPATVDLMVMDISGRRVAVLAAGQSVAPGQQVVTWQGRREDGSAAPAGVYWVVLRWSGDSDWRRIVKLD